jgi:hypothetical protein
MSHRTSPGNFHRSRSMRRLRAVATAALGVVGVAGLAWAAPASAQGAATGKIPELASSDFAWLAFGVHWFDPPAGLGRGPIRQDPAHPFHGNQSGPGQV